MEYQECLLNIRELFLVWNKHELAVKMLIHCCIIYIKSIEWRTPDCSTPHPSEIRLLILKIYSFNLKLVFWWFCLHLKLILLLCYPVGVLSLAVCWMDWQNSVYVYVRCCQITHKKYLHNRCTAHIYIQWVSVMPISFLYIAFSNP